MKHSSIGQSTAVHFSAPIQHACGKSHSYIHRQTSYFAPVLHLNKTGSMFSHKLVTMIKALCTECIKGQDHTCNCINFSCRHVEFPNRCFHVNSDLSFCWLTWQIFFAAVGAAGSIRTVIQTAPSLFLFSSIQIGIHLAIILAAGKLLGFSRKDVLLASNANVGGQQQELFHCQHVSERIIQPGWGNPYVVP